MKNTRLEKMKLKDLQDLKQRVESAIVACQERERVELKQKMAAMAAQAGFSLSELVGGRMGKKRGPVPVKYRHPDDASMTWTGRGRKPKWLVAAGGNIERFRVA